MVHTAVGYSRMSNRLRAFACTTSVGPGATNMVTGAAVATTNRIPVLLLPGDVFATRRANPVLQELEDPTSLDASVNDCLRPVSRYFDRIWRPEQLPQALLHAMRVLTDPAETGAVTLALPEDVQTEAFEVPEDFLVPRTWHIRRPPAEVVLLEQLARRLRASQRPLIVAGGGVIYSGATSALRAFVDATGIPVAETQAGKGSLPYDHAASVGALGATGHARSQRRSPQRRPRDRNRYEVERLHDSLFFGLPEPDKSTWSISTSPPFDTAKLSGAPIVADARSALTSLPIWSATGTSMPSYAAEYQAGACGVERHGRKPRTRWLTNPARSERSDRCGRSIQPGARRRGGAAGSLPGDLHKLWRTRDPKGYHVEYAFSTMGYEIAAGIGVKMADPSREVYVMVGDGSYLMLSSELRHRSRRRHQDHCRARGQPRIPIDWGALGVGGSRALRHEVSFSLVLGTSRWRKTSHRSRQECGESRCDRYSRALHRRSALGSGYCALQSRHHGHRDRDRSVGERA